jgi:tetratricopeptide (TPR) repeat protein
VKRFEPWQIVAGVAVLALVAFFVYTEMQRDHTDARPPEQMQAQPADMPHPPRVEIAPLEQAVAANPNDARALLRLANGLQDNGAYRRAIDVYDRYLAIEPDDPDARVDVGVCYFELGRADSTGAMRHFETARKEMEMALKKRPDHQPAAFNLGIVALNAGDLETSNRWFKRAVELGPQTDLGRRAQRILEQHSGTR